MSWTQYFKVSSLISFISTEEKCSIIQICEHYLREIVLLNASKKIFEFASLKLRAKTEGLYLYVSFSVFHKMQ